MKDRYVERQLAVYHQAESQTRKDDALYRLGTHLEVIECKADSNLTEAERQTVLDAVNKGVTAND